MPEPTKFEEDVFISYAHLDNLPLSEGFKGWVATFHERLRVRLTQLLGEEVRIWRDPKIGPNEDFNRTITDRIQNVAIFVSVLSPRYIKSPPCLDELTIFCTAAPKKCALLIGEKSRIFKVMKTPVPIKDHPPPLQNMLGYQFYEEDERGIPREFSPVFGPTREIKYWTKLEDLAWDIAQLVATIRNLHECENQPPSERKKIYLAETTFDLREERERIKRELQQHGHVVFPDRELPLVGELLRDAVKEYLKRSDLSVHLIGNRYGIIPEGEQKSIVHLQCDLAAAESSTLEQIIWMPVELQTRDEAQGRLIDSLRHGENGHRHVELMQTTLEDLKTFLQKKVAADNPTTEARTDANSRRLSVYLICDRQDLDATLSLEDYLEKLGFNVILPALEGEETQLLEDHKINLIECDAVLIYYGHANDMWLRMKQRELQKVAGYRRNAPLLAKGIFVSAPRTEAKERLRDYDAVITKNYEEFSPESLKPFLDRLQQAKRAHK